MYTDFEEIAEYLDFHLPSRVDSQFSYVNFGGCGIIAYIIANELEKIGLETEIAWLSTHCEGKSTLFEYLIKTNQQLTLLELNNNGIYVSHCLVVTNGYYIDSTGVYESAIDAGWTGRTELIRLKPKEFQSIAESDIGWNPAFDRSQIPAIETEIVDIVRGTQYFYD